VTKPAGPNARFPGKSGAREINGVSCMAHVLNLGAYVGKLFLEPAKGATQEQVLTLAEGYFSLSRDRLEQILRTVDDSVHEMADMFSVDPETVPSYSAVRQQAAGELPQLAMEAEAARQHAAARRAEADEKLRELG